MNVKVSELVEGNEILLRAETGASQIVEDVTTVNGRTTVLLIDGRQTTHPADQIVTVLS